MYAVLRKKIRMVNTHKEMLWALDGSVRWASDSWFQLRSWSQGGGIKPHVVGRGSMLSRVCLRFSLPQLVHAHMCSLSKINFKILFNLFSGKRKLNKTPFFLTRLAKMSKFCLWYFKNHLLVSLLSQLEEV